MSNELPLVCICIPTYNAAATIRETLESILAQTYPNLVIHVSDNASTDNTLEIVESEADARIHIHRLETNIGAEGNFNRCIQLAEGKYTAIFHADDVYEPLMVEKQVAFLEDHLEAGAVFTEASTIDEVGNRIGQIRLPKGVTSLTGLYDFSIMFKAVLQHSNFFICPSFMVRTEIYQQEIRIWRGEQFGSGADLDVWLRILLNHSIGHLPERLIRYRISNNQFSARIRLEIEQGVVFAIADHYLEQDCVKSLLNTYDILNYKWLERRDRVMRAVNLFLLDRLQEAGQLLNDIYSRDAWKAAFRSRHGLFTLVVGMYVMLLVRLGLKKIGKASLTFMKQVTHK
jgi:glycosyltransferase involved in cell wall biosynthesis